MTVQPSMQHLPARLVAAYLEGVVSERERSEVEEHMTACPECRHELVEVGRLMAKRRRTRLYIPAAAVAVAAAFALALGVSVIGEAQQERPMAVRAPEPSEVGTITAIAPAAESILSAGDDIRFVWSAKANGGTYRLTVLDESGGPAWSTETGDTVAVLPAEAGLEKDRAYFWFVDALASDGRTATSRARSFSLR